MRCKLDSTENPRSFEKYPTPPSGVAGFGRKASFSKEFRSEFRTARPYVSCKIFKGGPEPSEKLIRRVLVPIGRFHS